VSSIGRDGTHLAFLRRVTTFYTSSRRPRGPRAGHFAGRSRLWSQAPAARADSGRATSAGHAEAPTSLMVEDAGASVGSNASDSAITSRGLPASRRVGLRIRGGPHLNASGASHDRQRSDEICERLSQIGRGGKCKQQDCSALQGLA
jgi:hypothetical protein